MKQFDTHVCLVSGQSSPNLLPLLDDEMKPSQVVLLVTPEMKLKAEYLARVIRPRGINVVTHNLDSAANFDAIQDQLLEVLGSAEKDSVALNVSGGTKWMAIAAQEVFRVHDFSVFYVNLADDTVFFLGEKHNTHKLSQRIDLDNYLRAQGYEILRDEKPLGLPETERMLCERLLEKVMEWERALGQLNLLANTAEKRKRNFVTYAECEIQADNHLSALIAEFRQAKLIVSGKKDSVEFADDAARSFANGGWLEVYVNRKLQELKSDGVIQDSPRLNLKIRSPKGSENEIDVAFMARNHLHIIECKTRNLSGKQTGQAGSEAIYKLDSISSLGGLSTRAMLVCYRKLSKADYQRAKDLRIKTVQGDEIRNLKTILRDWIAGQ